jgi:probable F420-dependent oxidoreductase
MHYGLAIFPTEYSISPTDLGVAAEERGFESLWVAEHSHIPASRNTPWPGGAELPQMYYDVVDPFVALSMAAAVTKRLKLATGVCLVAQRDPIQTAKLVASLDRLSNGRFLFGIGGGWNVEEMNNHGTDATQRWKILRERVEAMKAIWADERAEYQGQFVSFDPVIANPKPAQKPHPPIHVGGAMPWGLRRALRYGNGWIPILGRGAGDIDSHMPAVRAALKDAGRDPQTFEVSVYGCPPDADRLQRYRDAGLARAVFILPPAQRDQILPILDTCATMARNVG